MAVAKTSTGRWKAVLKSRGAYVTSRTFDTKGAAEAWLVRERAALDGGLDPRAGRVLVKRALTQWLEVRRTQVAAKTARADADLERLLTPALRNLAVSAVEPRHLRQWYKALEARGLAHGSIERHRQSLSRMFAWCVDEHMLASNPVSKARLGGSNAPAEPIKPFSEAELAAVVAACRMRDTRLADIVVFAAWSGLRWGELRSVRIGALRMTGPVPAIWVGRSRSEGLTVKSTKGKRGRWVPLADEALEAAKRLAGNRAASELLATTRTGHQLWRGSVLRTLDWGTVGLGRRIHDLRHTAACLWLAAGVPLTTVQAWLGHRSIQTTSRYLHHLGDGDDLMLQRLNRRAEMPAKRAPQRAKVQLRAPFGHFARRT